MLSPRALVSLLRCSSLPRALVLGAGLALGCERAPALVGEHMKRGDIALAEGHYPQAIAAYNHARELAPHDPEVQRALMRARVFVVAETPARVSADAFEDARYEAQLLLDTDKGREALYLCALGNLLARQGDVEGAKSRFAEALKIDPSSPLAHAGLGLALTAHKEGLPQAKSELEAALRSRPDLMSALVALGQIKLAEGDLVSAADRLESALRTGDDFNARMALGSVRVQQQKPAEAIEHFQRAAQLDPRSADALTSLGQALLGLGKADEAERALRAALQLRQDQPAMVALGFALSRQKKAEQALGVFGQVLSQDGGVAPALYGAAMASEDLGRPEQAMDFYRRLLALPTDGPQKQVLGDLRKEAQTRLIALSAALPASSASSGPAAPRRPDPLNTR
ncbi:MAG: tetratricopeptide repeat protein, partial [Minicystis sp.]